MNIVANCFAGFSDRLSILTSFDIISFALLIERPISSQFSREELGWRGGIGVVDEVNISSMVAYLYCVLATRVIFLG